MKPYYEDDYVTILHGDCREILPVCGRPYFVVTDPPYGTGGWRRAKAGAGADPTAQLIREDWDDGATDWLRLVPNAPIATFWPAGRAVHLLNMALEVGLTQHRACYMRKRDPKPVPGGRTRWSVEPVWLLGDHSFGPQGDVLDVSTPREGRDNDATGHPYQKPIEAMTWLVAMVAEGCTVVDPFMGAGTTLVAAKTLGRKAVGIEKDERWCEKAAERCAQEVLDLGVAA